VKDVVAERKRDRQAGTSEMATAASP
jgi:hypothetical protein